MDVSVCIVNWNTRELLRNCLESIARCTRDVQHEVIVVDNASADGSAEMLRTEFPRVKLIASTLNLGFARGSNLAAAAAKGRYVLYLNPDTELVTNAMRGLVALLDGDPSIGAAGCRLLNSDGSIQYTCASSFPSPRNELTSMLFLDRMFPAVRLFSARELGYWDHADSRDVECLSGACIMLPRPLDERLAGFDDKLFMYGEDLDLCCRIRAAGLRLHYLSSEVIYHHEGAASKKRGRSFAPLFQRAANYYFLRKNFGRTSALGYRLAVSLGAGARLLAGLCLSPLLALRRRTPISLPDFLARHAELLMWSLGLKRLPQR